MSVGPSVLITRPEPGAAATALLVAQRGWTPVLAPALVLRACPTEAPAGAQALLLPSAAAIPAAAAAAPAGLPALAVGAATAAAARRAGLAGAVAAAGDAAALAALAAARFDPAAGPLWLAAGAGYGAELETLLQARGFVVARRIAYVAAPATALPDAARAALSAGSVVAALFFSPRSAECAITLLRSAGFAAQATTMAAVALSPRIAEAARAALAPEAWGAVHVAARPDQDSLLDRLDAMGPPNGPPRGTR